MYMLSFSKTAADKPVWLENYALVLHQLKYIEVTFYIFQLVKELYFFLSFLIHLFIYV